MAETWYEATAERGAARPAFSGRAAADVCVIGGGLAGITLALELARAGKSVILLEAKRLAWGASSRNGGFVSAGFAEGMDNVVRRVGLPAAKELHRLSEEGALFVRQNAGAARMGEGMIVARRHPGSFAQECEAHTRDFGESFESWPVEKTRAALRTERYFDALYKPAAIHIHPLRYALAAAADAERAGARIYENSQALGIETSSKGAEVRTAGGLISCGHAVVAVSSLDRRLHRPTGRAVLPVATYVAVTEPLRQSSIMTGAAIADTRRAGDYYRLVDGGRLLWGGRITTKITEPLGLAKKMRGDMVAVYPELGEPRIDHAWAGLMGYARHKMPLIGRDACGVWFATAFGGHGLNTTAMAALLLSRAIAAGDDEYRRFAPFTPQWAGGPFGRAGVQASYWWMQARDRWDERS